MSPPAGFVDLANTIPSRRPRVNCGRMSRTACLVAVWCLTFSTAARTPAYCQIASSPASAQSTAQSSIGESSGMSRGMSDDSDDSREDGTVSINSGRMTSQTALSADQIINILQERPESCCRPEVGTGRSHEAARHADRPKRYLRSDALQSDFHERQPACKYHICFARERVCIRRRSSVYGIE